MKNPVVSYAIIAVGVIGLIIGGILIATGHHSSAYGALGLGAVLAIVGVIAMFVLKPKSAIK